ncbi:SDR family oxidoreductase [Marinobacter mobilis]|uniref:Nucleoside-diphosphate-sugar epimerase n=1 Tax=Marinobacter mobilis TaxID=488533 RepID=A0A1H2SM56_9GAMM|nr:SDR family oxidoreductase [Marinobacter mobilis]SDW32668.1 Nucleoside-diphosphate-sugar epimerase [Marinobacter mobilis]
MTVLITGATGFIGRHLCAHLTRHHQPVLALMRQPAKLSELRQQVSTLGGQGELVDAIAGDLDAPGLGLTSALPNDITAVVHLGARFAWAMDPAVARKTNVEGSLAATELAHKLGVRMVFISGFMLENRVHLERLGIKLANLSDTDWEQVYQQAGSYEASKLEGALKSREYAVARDMDWVEVQPATLTGSTATGELDTAQPLFQMIDNLNHGRMALIPGSPEHWLPLVSVDTLVSIIAAAISAPTPPERILALDPATPNLKGLLALMAAPLGVKPPAYHIPSKLLAWLLKIPGLATKLNTAPESLHFIQPTRFDTTSSCAFMEGQGITLPPIHQVVQSNARWYREKVLT